MSIDENAPAREATAAHSRPPPPVQGIKPPQPLVVGPNIMKDWKLFQQKWSNYSVITNLSRQSRAYQVALLLHTLGDDALKIYNGFHFDTPEDQRTMAEVIAKFQEFAVGEVNETYERFMFNRRCQHEGESFESFLAAIRSLIKTCNYCDNCVDTILRDRIVLGIRDPDTQTQLLKERALTTTVCIAICKAAESATARGHVLRDHDPSLNRVADYKTLNSEKTLSYEKKRSTFGQKSFVKTCLFCNKTHALKKELCPAFGKTCHVCKMQNHFAGAGAGDSDSQSSMSAPQQFWLGSLRSGEKSNKNSVYAKMSVDQKDVVFQLDSGAETNTICKQYVNRNSVRPTTRILRAWNGSQVKPIGEATLDILNTKTNELYTAEFVVVSNNYSNLLGLATLGSMNLIHVNKDIFHIASVSEKDITKSHPTVFGDDQGKLPAIVKLSLCESPDTKILPARNLPFAIRDDTKKELDRLVQNGILEPVNEPTEWVSQMAVTRKKNGTLRVCIDPAPLNCALRREHYKLPTIEDTLDKFSDCRVFSKLDVKNAYWHLELDDASSLLTTMITPFGRYKWKRLPFGLSVSGEIFQRHLTEALADLDGVICVADDKAVLSKDDAQHESQLEALLQRCEEINIKLNKSPDKLQIRCQEMTLYGHVFSVNGVKPDSSKVKALRDMPAPKDVAGVLLFCGLAQYLARFLPNLAEVASPLRALTCKDAQWEWTSAHEDSFKAIKKMACEAPILNHYNPVTDLVLQTDA